MDEGRCTGGILGQLRSGRVTILLLAMVVCLAGSCVGLPRKAAVALEPPEQLQDGWETSSPEAEGLDAMVLSELTNKFRGDTYGYIHGCVIIRNGKLIYEQYFHGFRQATLHRLYSVTKSVTSALMGIALEQGLIDGLQERAIDYFPEYVDDDWDQRKDGITLEHLLTMASGLAYDEWTYRYSDARNSYTQMTGSSDWMKWTFDQPLLAEPGMRFTYSSGNSHLFSGILFKATGMFADEYAEQVLFGPLGIADYEWVNGNGYPATSGAMGGLKLRPRDMAKLGFVYLNDGKWNGDQVVPGRWVTASLTPRMDAGGGTYYGYQWWLHSSTVSGHQVEWMAGRGYGDQLIGVFPSLNMVIVITAGNESRAAGLDDAVLSILRAAL